MFSSSLTSVLRLTVQLTWMAILAGCCAIPGRCPKQEDSLAAREQGQLALQYLHRGKLEEAEVRFEHALENCPEDVRLRHDLATLRRRQGRLQEAIDEMKAAVASSGGEPEWLAELAEMQLLAGDLIGAHESADLAIRRQPSLALGWRVRGDTLKQSNRLEDALRDYHRSLSVDADNSGTLMQVAEVYRMLGKPRRALSTLQRLEGVGSPNEFPGLPRAQALAYQALQRHEEALLYFKVAQATNAEDPQMLVAMAHSQIAVGDQIGAIATVQSAVRLDPRNQAAQQVMASLEQGQRLPRIADVSK